MNEASSIKPIDVENPFTKGTKKDTHQQGDPDTGRDYICG